MPCGEINFLGTPGIIVQNTATPGVCVMIVKVNGGPGFRKLDITPSCARPYYEYGFQPPVLINVRPYNPGDLDND